MTSQDLEIPIGKRTFKYRFFEMLPALLSYALLALPVILSVINPLAASIFIISFIITWFVKAIAMAYRTIRGYQHMQQARKVDWLRRLSDLEDVQLALEAQREPEWREERHQVNLTAIAAHRSRYYQPSQVYNAVIIPFYKEDREVIEPTVQSLLSSHYNCKTNLMLILAYEERAGDAAAQLAGNLIATYGDKFFHAGAVMHPQGLPNEIAGKGANITYAGRYLKKVLDGHSIDPDKVIVTTLDCDDRPDPSYFAYVAYEYIVDLKHKQRAYQPIALYLGNIWDVPAAIRVIATGNSFWNIVMSQRAHRLRNFSSHSQGMSSLLATNFWSVRTIVEDGHQYWRSYFQFKGDYEVTPIYVPIYMGVVLGSTYSATLKAQFVQLRRWAYGASDIAYVANLGFSGRSRVPFLSFISRFLVLLDSHVSWASASVIVTFGAWAPLLLSQDAYRSIIANELPRVAGVLQQFATVGLFITVFLSFKILPPRPKKYRNHRSILVLLQWALMPVTSIIYSSTAAFYSQNRLLFGKYFDRFDVTVKERKTGS